jgi:hypothetical protein
VPTTTGAAAAGSVCGRAAITHARARDTPDVVVIRAIVRT